MGETTKETEFRDLVIYKLKAKLDDKGEPIIGPLGVQECEKTDEVILKERVRQPNSIDFRRFRLKTADYLKRILILEKNTNDLEASPAKAGWAVEMENLNENYLETLEIFIRYAAPFLKKHGVERDFTDPLADSQLLLSVCSTFVEVWGLKEETAKN